MCMGMRMAYGVWRMGYDAWGMGTKGAQVQSFGGGGGGLDSWKLRAGVEQRGHAMLRVRTFFPGSAPSPAGRSPRCSPPPRLAQIPTGRGRQGYRFRDYHNGSKKLQKASPTPNTCHKGTLEIRLIPVFKCLGLVRPILCWVRMVVG